MSAQNVGPEHTPGEWRLQGENCGGGYNVEAQVWGTWVRVAHTSEIVFGGQRFVTPEIAKANATLIASAPTLAADLAEALRLIEQVLENFLANIDGDPEPHSQLAWNEEADALLSKHRKAGA